MTLVTKAISRAPASVSGLSAVRSASVSAAMIVKHGLCVNKREVKIGRSAAPVSKMIRSSIAFASGSPRVKSAASRLAFEIKGCLIVGLNAGRWIGHNCVYCCNAGPGERELRITNSKRALGCDEGSLKLKTGGSLKRDVGAVAEIGRAH